MELLRDARLHRPSPSPTQNREMLQHRLRLRVQVQQNDDKQNINNIIQDYTSLGHE